MAGNFRSKTFFSDIYVHTKHVSAVIYTFSTHRSTSIHFMGCFDVYEQWKWYTAHTHTHRNWRVIDLPAGGMASSAFSEVFQYSHRLRIDSKAPFDTPDFGFWLHITQAPFQTYCSLNATILHNIFIFFFFFFSYFLFFFCTFL